MATIGCLRLDFRSCIFSAFLLLVIFTTETVQGPNERKLLDYLFTTSGYNKLERPVKVESQALNVSFGTVLQQIIDVDEKNQIIHTNMWLNIQWTDFNLAWNESRFGGITSIRLPPSLIWKPDILLYNSADEDIDSTFPTNVVVSSSGSCLWVPPGLFKSTCKIDITWFPFDEQHCTMKFGSWTYDSSGIDLQLPADSGDVSSFIENGEWLLIGMPAKRNVLSYDCCPEQYIDITFTVHIRRRTLFYGFNLIIPCVLISTMALLTFTLPPEAGEKISLGVTILLSLTVFLLLVAEAMPPTSDAVPLIGMYFACIMLMCSLSVVFTVLVLNCHHRSPEMHVMPAWVRKVVCEWLAALLRMRRPLVEADNTMRPQQQTTRRHSARSTRPHIKEVNELSPLVSAASAAGSAAEPNAVVNGSIGVTVKPSRTCATVVDVTSLLPQCRHSVAQQVCSRNGFHRRSVPTSTNGGCASPSAHRTHHSPMSPAAAAAAAAEGSSGRGPTDTVVGSATWCGVPPSRRPAALPLYRVTVFDREPLPSHHRETRTVAIDDLSRAVRPVVHPNVDDVWHSVSDERPNATVSTLQAVLNELRFMTSRLKDDDRRLVVCSEWKFAAMVIDRLCLIVFSIFTIVSTFAILFSAPHVIT